ncbi:hypothetical protein HDU98_004404 [Podochytrium sp. JEL0797]|nr:hypothetical protein HDU98_004404 [Podochytrium sp. JEL0797]
MRQAKQRKTQQMSILDFAKPNVRPLDTYNNNSNSSSSSSSRNKVTASSFLRGTSSSSSSQQQQPHHHHPPTKASPSPLPEDEDADLQRAIAESAKEHERQQFQILNEIQHQQKENNAFGATNTHPVTTSRLASLLASKPSTSSHHETPTEKATTAFLLSHPVPPSTSKQHRISTPLPRPLHASSSSTRTPATTRTPPRAASILFVQDTAPQTPPSKHKSCSRAVFRESEEEESSPEIRLTKRGAGGALGMRKPNGNASPLRSRVTAVEGVKSKPWMKEVGGGEVGRGVRNEVGVVEEEEDEPFIPSTYFAPRDTAAAVSSFPPRRRWRDDEAEESENETQSKSGTQDSVLVNIPQEGGGGGGGASLLDHPGGSMMQESSLPVAGTFSFLDHEYDSGPVASLDEEGLALLAEIEDAAGEGERWGEEEGGSSPEVGLGKRRVSRGGGGGERVVVDLVGERRGGGVSDVGSASKRKVVVIDDEDDEDAPLADRRKNQNTQKCPLCFLLFPLPEIQLHASTCCGSITPPKPSSSDSKRRTTSPSPNPRRTNTPSIPPTSRRTHHQSIHHDSEEDEEDCFVKRLETRNRAKSHPRNVDTRMIHDTIVDDFDDVDDDSPPPPRQAQHVPPSLPASSRRRREESVGINHVWEDVGGGGRAGGGAVRDRVQGFIAGQQQRHRIEPIEILNSSEVEDRWDGGVEFDDDAYEEEGKEEERALPNSLSPLKGFVDLRELKERGELGSLEGYFNQFSSAKKTAGAGSGRRGSAAGGGEASQRGKSRGGGYSQRKGAGSQRSFKKKKYTKRGAGGESQRGRGRKAAGGGSGAAAESFNHYADCDPDVGAFPGAGEMRWEAGRNFFLMSSPESSRGFSYASVLGAPTAATTTTTTNNTRIALVDRSAPSPLRAHSPLHNVGLQLGALSLGGEAVEPGFASGGFYSPPSPGAAKDSWAQLDQQSPPQPLRRQSVSFPQTPDYHHASVFLNPPTPVPIHAPHSDDDDDLVLSRKRNIRSRTASTPNALMTHAQIYANDPYAQQSIWNQQQQQQQQNDQKQYRSLSYSLDMQQQQQSQQQQSQSQQPDLQRRSSFVNDEAPSPFQQPQRARTPLLGVMDHASPSTRQQQPVVDMDNDFGFQSAGRSRSKSSAATYGLPDSYLPQGSAGHGSSHHQVGPSSSPGSTFDPMNSIWANDVGGGGPVGVSGNGSSILHRRSSTQPSMMDTSRGGWDGGSSMQQQQQQQQREPLRGDDDAFGVGDMDKYRRRHSHAPNLYADLAAQMVNSMPSDHNDLYDTRRRHSMAGPPLYKNYLNDMDALYDVKGDVPLFEEINDYFENTEHRTKAWVEAGKNLQKQSSYTQQYWPVYVIEFKAGRIDYFHAADCAPGQVIRNGDLVIVEADRGKDLGKVVHDNLANLAQLHMFQSQHKDIMVESLISSKEIQPKRIYGLAQQSEVALLVSKAQDEAKAQAVCQAKIRQRKLPMEIVDAEYQWDRKKLTFYFVADRRVDFRELIRDLFKLYKTRIWMCAVDPTKMPRPF